MNETVFAIVHMNVDHGCNISIGGVRGIFHTREEAEKVERDSWDDTIIEIPIGVYSKEKYCMDMSEMPFKDSNFFNID